MDTISKTLSFYFQPRQLFWVRGFREKDRMIYPQNWCHRAKQYYIITLMSKNNGWSMIVFLFQKYLSKIHVAWFSALLKNTMTGRCLTLDLYFDSVRLACNVSRSRWLWYAKSLCLNIDFMLNICATMNLCAMLNICAIINSPVMLNIFAYLSICVPCWIFVQ